MKLSEVLSPGDKIDIKMIREQREEASGGQMANVFRSSVYGFAGELSLVLHMPTQGGRMVLFPKGVRCEFVFYTRRGMYCCFGVMNGRSSNGNQHLLEAELASVPEKFRRREFFRVKYAVDFQYCQIDKETAGLPLTEQILTEIRSRDYPDRIRRGVLQDISGGGVRFTSYVPHERGDFLMFMVRLNNSRFDETFYLVCQIIASGKRSAQEGAYNNRAKFIFKDLKDREKIVGFVYEEERNIRRKEIG